MGFYYASSGKRPSGKSGGASQKKNMPVDTLRRMGCTACPLNVDKEIITPRMSPSGSKKPSIYILGEAPGEEEDIQGQPFVGKSGRLLRSQFDSEFMRREVRIGNTIRCRPPGNRTPEMVELECCHDPVAKDIAEHQPLVVVGAGNTPLNWATGFSSITALRGRLIATRIGDHDCWYYPILHPSFVLRNQSKYGKSGQEMAFEHDLAWLIKNYDNLPPVKVYDPPYDDGCVLIEGRGTEDFHQLEDILNELAREPRIAIDLETNGIRPYRHDPAIYLFSAGTFDRSVSFPIDYPDTWSSTLHRQVSGLVADFLLGSGRKIAHQLAFELEWLTYRYGKELAYLTEWEDTMAQAHTLDERIGVLSLDDLTRIHFGFNLKKQSRVDPVRLLEFPIREGLRYNCMDSKWCYQLDQVQIPEIDKVAALRREYEHQVRLQPTLVLMQQKGALVDFEYAAKMEQTLTKELKQIESKIDKCPEVDKYRSRYGPFSPTAPEQVLKLMSSICQRSEINKEDGGQTSDEGALSKIPASEVPSAPLILEHRATSKLIGTYITPIIKRTNVFGDRIHCKYNSMVAVTGRLASEDPNMQNFPKRKRREIRGVIVAPENQWMVAADYGQIEARVFAMASEDDALTRALWDGYDIHGFWADRFMQEYPRIKDRIITDYGVDGDDAKLIRKKFRDEIKNGWVFPQFFGSSIKSSAANLQVPVMIAEDLGKEFWNQFSGVKRWQGKLIKSYERNFYVETLTGVRRHGPMTKNELLNHPIQGTAATIVKEAMISLAEMSVILDDDFFLPFLNVHDDLTDYLPDDGLETYLLPIAREMCKPRFDFINVPLIIEVSVGERWNQLEEIAVYRSNELFDQRNPYA